MKKLILLLSFMACLCLDGHAKTIYLDLSQAKSQTFETTDTATWTTDNGVSYTMGLPGGTTQDQWYGIRLGDFSKADFLSSSNTLDGELVVVSSGQTKSDSPLFQISVWGVDANGNQTKLKLGESQEDATFPEKTKEGDGDQKCTINLAAIKKQIVDNGDQDVDPSPYTSYRVYLMHYCTAADDNSSITIKKVYVHHKTHTGDVDYDPNNGRHYVNLSKSEAWSAWGCVSISNDDKGNMVVHIEPKKKADGTSYYTDDFGSPRVLGGLVLDIDGRDFSQVLRVQMNQQGGDVQGTYQTENGEVTSEDMTSHLLTYLDVAKSDGTDINDNGKFWYSQYDFRYTHYQKESESVKLMEWTADWPYGSNGTDTHLPTNFKSQDITISQFLISYDIFRAEPWHEASLRNAPMYDNKDGKITIDDEHYDYTTGILVQPSTRVYGSTIGFNNRYADVSHVKEIRIYATYGMQFKGVFNFGLETEKDVTVTTGTETSQTYNGKYKGQSDKKIYYLYTMAVPEGVTRLNVIATTKDSKAGTIDNITLYDPESPIDYFISGQMFTKNTASNASTDAAKENRLAMNIDATDLRNKGDNKDNKIDLTSANKNCLIYVNNNTQLSNTYNVVVRSGSYPDYKYTADNIVLTDAVKSYMDDNKKGKQVADYHYPFFAPYDITATKVTYQGYTGAYGTLCLPFAFSANDLTVDSGTAPTLYTLSGTTSYDNDRKMTVADATSTPSLSANQPAIVVNANGSNISYTVTKANTTITHTAAADLNITNPQDINQTDASIKVEGELSSGNLQGVYSMRHPEQGSYVLQKQQGHKEVMFHKVVNTQPMMTQFRAYFTLPADSKAKAFNAIGLRFLQGDQPTGIESAQQSVTTAKVVARYNAIGERIATPVKGLNIVKLSDGTTKKIIVK